MNRAQLYHEIRTACTILEQDSLVIIGSQAILGSFDEDDLPLETTMSNEIDTLPYGESHEEIVMLAARVEGVASEWSDFDIEHGFHIDGVDETTAILPNDWMDRLVPVRAASTVNIITGQQYTGLCLDPHDLCAAKLCVGREKDHQFVRTLLGSRQVDPEIRPCFWDELGPYLGQMIRRVPVAFSGGEMGTHHPTWRGVSCRSGRQLGHDADPLVPDDP